MFEAVPLASGGGLPPQNTIPTWHLSDVADWAPSDKQVLKWNALSGQYEPSDLSAGGGNLPLLEVDVAGVLGGSVWPCADGTHAAYAGFRFSGTPNFTYGAGGNFTIAAGDKRLYWFVADYTENYTVAVYKSATLTKVCDLNAGERVLVYWDGTQATQIWRGTRSSTPVAFATFSRIGSTLTIKRSEGFSGISYIGGGVYQFLLQRPQPNTDYGVIGSAGRINSGGAYAVLVPDSSGGVNGKNTGGFRAVITTWAGNAEDVQDATFVVYGV